MGEVTWVLTINVFVSAFLVVRPSEFPSFFDENDLKDLGVKGHRSRYHTPTVTGRSTDHLPGHFPVPKTDQNTAIIPPNGLPVEEEEEDSVFPADDGKAFGGADSMNLDQLPKRLTETGKEKYKEGQVMKNWEDDAHMWAKEKKEAARQAIKDAPMGEPSVGLSAYWPDSEDDTPTPSSQANPLGDPTAEGEGFDNKKLGVETATATNPKTMGLGPEIPMSPGMGQGPEGGMNMGGSTLSWGHEGSPSRGPYRSRGSPKSRLSGLGPGGPNPLGGWGEDGGPMPDDYEGTYEPGGPPPLGKKKGGQGQGSLVFMGGAPPPGWHPSKAPGDTNVGLPPSAQGQSTSGGMNMGVPPTGWGQLPGGAKYPVRGQIPGGGMNMGGPPPVWGQGGGQGSNEDMEMDGPPPGLGQAGDQGSGGKMGMVEPPPAWEQGGGQSPGGEMSMHGPHPGWGQGGGQGPGGEMSMYGPHPGWGQGGGQGPNGKMGMAGGLPRWGQGGGQSPNLGLRSGGPPAGWGQGGGQSPGRGLGNSGSLPGWGQGGGHVPGQGMGNSGPPLGWSQGGGPVPGAGMNMGRQPPGWGQSEGNFPGGGVNMDGPPKGWGQSPEGGMNMGEPPSSWGKGGGLPRGPNRGGGRRKSGLSGLGLDGPNLAGWGQDSSPMSYEDEGPGAPGFDGSLPMKGNRRQMEENMPDYGIPNNNLRDAPHPRLPPIYYKGNPDVPHYPDMPTGQDDRWMLPGQEQPPALENPNALQPDYLKRLKPRPDTAGSLMLDEPVDIHPSFDENVQSNNLPRYSKGRMPGPGSERDFPSGYVPQQPSPLEMSQNNMYSEQGGRHDKAGSPFGDNYQSMADALREANIPGMSDYPELQKALRMGGPGQFQSPPGPGSEDNFPSGYRPKVAGGSIKQGRPGSSFKDWGGSVMQIRTPIIEHHPPPGMDRARYPEWKHMHGEVPEYEDRPSGGKQGAWQGPLGSSGFSPPGEPAFQPPGVGEGSEGLRMPSGMPIGPVQGKGGPPPQEPAYSEYSDIPDEENPALRQNSVKEPEMKQVVQTAIKYSSADSDQAGFKPRNRYLPSGYALMQIAQKKLAGELYVPIVDESMSRLGWTTEALNMTVTEASTKAPEESVIKVVLRTMNLNKTSEQEWLAFETVLGPKHRYESECKMLSCSYSVNGGATKLSNATWNEMYPEYDYRQFNPDVPKGQQAAGSPPSDKDYYEE
uniref:Uncharacterized protein n=1 Tax=Heliothis virescens TaxID=7102 RepID=A0A2A4KB80_HELVI